MNLGKETMCGFEVTKSEKERCEKSYTDYSGETAKRVSAIESPKTTPDDLPPNVIHILTKLFRVEPAEIKEIVALKKGMTNHSIRFSVNGEKYIMRIPGEGTDRLIDRKQEASVFRVISGKGFCDDPVYINPEDGCKITKFLDGVRVCDPHDEKDLRRCMKQLSDFHKCRLFVEHTFDLFGRIEFYEALWDGKSSVYPDYAATKERVLSLKPFIDKTQSDWCLTHIDAVPDNFLFYQTAGGEALQLTDWEYAGMQDPHVDIAMFCIYSLYNKRQIDRLIRIYFEEFGETCSAEIRAKIYCYISVCGLLWSNWCEFKRQVGMEFGEYSLRQYCYAKEYYIYARKEIEKIHEQS